jgi:hypothetical protein
MCLIVLTVKPLGKGQFAGYVNGELVVERSAQPFLDAARVLKSRGWKDHKVMVMRHEGSSTDSLKATIGEGGKMECDRTVA